MNKWTENFAWDSEEQEKGFRSFEKWARDKGVSSEIRPADLFFIQKDHESNIYWTELVGSQISKLQDQLQAIHNDIAELRNLLVSSSNGKEPC